MTNANALPIQERLREHVAGGGKFDSHVEAADRIDALEKALRTMVYETTSLSPLEDDGSHWCKISGEALAAARAALGEGE